MQDFAERKRAAAASHKGDHAEGATVIASVLHLKVGASLLVVRIEDGRGQQFAMRKNIFHHNRCAMISRGGRRGLNQRAKRDEAVSGGDLRKAMLVRISDDQRDPFEGGNLFGGALRIASGNNDLRRRIRAMDAPNGGTRILVGRRSYGTCVQDDDFGCSRRSSSRQTALGQLAFDGRTVGLGGATTEVFNIEIAHGSIIWAPPDSTGSSVLLCEDCFPANQNPGRLKYPTAAALD